MATSRDEDLGTMHLLLKSKKAGTTGGNPGATLETLHHTPDPSLLGIDVDMYARTPHNTWPLPKTHRYGPPVATQRLTR